MTDEQALLAAVAANVDDDTPRLVYADYLDDHGQAERAEFIRAQVHVARVGPGDEGAITAHERQAELLSALGQDWLPANWPFGPAPDTTWRRGFITDVGMSDGGLTTEDVQALAAAPTVECMSLRETTIGADAIRGLGKLPNLRDCYFTNTPALAGAGLAAVARWPAVRLLHLSGTCLDGGFAGLAGMERLRSFAAERIRDAGEFSDADLAPLAGLTGLEEVRLSSPAVTGRGFDALAPLPRLRRLALRECGLDGDALARLADCQSLEELDISWAGSGSGDALLEAVPRLRQLRVLHAHRHDLTDRGYEAVGLMTQLEELRVGGEGFGADAVVALTGLTRLRRLEVRPGTTTPIDLSMLGRLAALRALDLTHYFDGASAVDLATRLSELRWLALGALTLTDDQMDRLRELRHLEVLVLVNTQVTDRGIARLGPDSPLRFLGAYGADVTREFVWDRRAEWAPRLEAAVAGRANVGMVWHPDYLWDRF